MLEVNGLTKKWRHFALKDVTFRIEPGCIMGLVGRNGAGKTTAIRMIVGGLKPDKGDVRICGYDLFREGQQARDRIGFILEAMPFIQEYTLEENAGFFGPLYSVWDMDTFRRCLKRYDLSPDMSAKSLSRGMRVRFQLAFALAHHPSVLVMDEPAAGLDPVFRREFYYELQSAMEREEMSVLISTHVTADLDRIADYVTMLESGKMLFSDSREALSDRYRVFCVAADDWDGFNRRYGARILAAERKGSSYEVFAESGLRISAGTGMQEMNCFDGDRNPVERRASLSDIMYYMIKRQTVSNKERAK